MHNKSFLQIQLRLTNASVLADTVSKLFSDYSIIFIGATFITLQIFIYADYTFDIFVIDPNTDALVLQENVWYAIGASSATQSYTSTPLQEIVARFCRTLKQNPMSAKELISEWVITAKSYFYAKSETELQTIDPKNKEGRYLRCSDITVIE